jgi:hypothetical protein
MSPSEFICAWMDAYNNNARNIANVVGEEFGISAKIAKQKAQVLVKNGVLLPGYNVDNTLEENNDVENDEEGGNDDVQD